MKKMPKFSIIVPIYKVEKYIVTCIESVLNQTFKDFEIILVDDGSPDKCGQICDNYERIDSRIKVLHKKNGGLSSARNAGIDIAEGEYVIFLDSDDYWDDSNALESIYKNLEETNADLLVFLAKRFYEEKNIFTSILDMNIDRDKVIDLDTNKAIKYLIENNIYRAAAWNKVIRKKVIDNQNMRFKIGYLSEDMDWCGDLLLHCSRFDVYEKPIYVYRQQRSGSITAVKNEKLVLDKLYMCKKGYTQAISMKDMNKEVSELLAGYYAYEYSVLLGISGGIKNKAILSEIEELQSILNFDISKKVHKVLKLKKVLGYKWTRILLILFVRMKR